jgi:threonine dehydrogenase-like Zn-dependent dehydrogenase
LKAAVYRGPRNIKLEDVPDPIPSPNKTLVKFRAGSICGTDLHFYRGEWKIKPGRIIGHDACGVRTDTGERVALVPVIYCGTCYYCQLGFPTNCEKYGQFMGIDKNGFFAESIVLRPKYLIPIPENVKDEEAAITEPVALAVHVLDMLKPKIDYWTTIIGQGPIGLLMTQVAKLKGCRVIAVDLEDYRLDLAGKYGADVCINAKHEEPIARVRDVTKRGSDMVIEAAGKTSAVEQTPFMVRKGGKVAMIGEFRGRMDLKHANDAEFFTTYVSPLEYPTALRLIADKKVDVSKMITHRFKLAKFETAIETANNPAEKPLKVNITS